MDTAPPGAPARRPSASHSGEPASSGGSDLRLHHEAAHDDVTRRRRMIGVVITAALALALLFAAGLAVGLAVGRGQGGAPHAEPLTASGPIGPWQRYGHASSEREGFEAAAADPSGVLLIGDSVAARIRDDLARALHEQRRPLSWDHWNGRPTHGAADTLVALDAAGHQPRTLVVVSGENDIFEPYLFATQVERFMRTAGPQRQVHWLVPLVSRPDYTEADIANSARLAEVLVDASMRHPNLHLIEWRDHLTQLDDATRTKLMPDGVHPSPVGSEEMVRLTMGSLSLHASSEG